MISVAECCVRKELFLKYLKHKNGSETKAYKKQCYKVIETNQFHFSDEYEYQGDYENKDKSYCRPSKVMKDVANVTAARKECSDDPKCGMFVDNGGTGTKFYSCASDANIYSSRKSTIYFKGKFLPKICDSFDDLLF